MQRQTSYSPEDSPIEFNQDQTITSFNYLALNKDQEIPLPRFFRSY